MTEPADPDAFRLPQAVEDALADLHAAGAAPTSALVEQWCRAFPESGEHIRATVASLARLAATDRPASIGPYRIVRELGEGGMGTVYLAEQETPVRRQVALKLVKLGMDSRAVVARFEQERQALAWMEDDGIARVYDCGATSTGQPFFVMEYVDGVPLTDFCDRHRLSVRARLELMQQVCAAVTHAHQKGIVHRDLKPGNVLATETAGRWRTKVIDFGLAKAVGAAPVDARLVTQVGGFLGTAEYMAPEQAGAGHVDIDTRADVYSLGVILYELLTGGLPFPGEMLRKDGLVGIARILREVEPDRPSARIASFGSAATAVAELRRTSVATLKRELRSDLDWVVMKALEKDRTRRYATAEALAEDLRRFLCSEPLQAGPPTTVYRLRKLVWRYRGLCAAAAAVFVTALVGAGIALGHAHAAEVNRKAAVVAQGKAEAQERLATSRAVEVKQVADFQTKMLGDVSMDRFGVVLARLLHEEAARGLRQLPEGVRAPTLESFQATLRRANLTNVARTALGEILFVPAVQTAERDYADRPPLQARLLSSLAWNSSSLGMFSLGERAGREAVRILADGEHDASLDMLQAKIGLASALEGAGRLDEAEELFEVVLEGRKQLLGSDDPATLAAQNRLAVAMSYQGRQAEAEPLLRDALAGQRARLGDDHLEALHTASNLAAACQALGRHGEAEALLRDTLERAVRTQGDGHILVLTARNNLATLLMATRRTAEAEEPMRGAFEGMRSHYGDDHIATQRTRFNLALVLRDLGQLDEAQALLAEALRRWRDTAGSTATVTLSVLHALGGVLLRQRQWPEAELHLREALVGREATLGDHLDTADSMARLATALREQGKLTEAEQLLQRVVTMYGQLGDDGELARHAIEQLSELRRARQR